MKTDAPHTVVAAVLGNSAHIQSVRARSGPTNFLETVRRTAMQPFVTPSSTTTASAKESDRVPHPPEHQHAKKLAQTPNSDSDDVWEDAVDDLESRTPARKTSTSTTVPVPMGTVIEDTTSELERLEREAATIHRTWKQTRDLSYWRRYNECRARIAALKVQRQAPVAPASERDARWLQLVDQKKQRERRLVELAERRERIRWARCYEEKTRSHHAQLAQTQLEDKLRQLDEEAQVRRLERLQRVQQLVSELNEEQQRKPAQSKPEQTRSAPAVKAEPEDAGDDVFTHVWDDFRHWEKMVSDDEGIEDMSWKRPALSPVGTKPSIPSGTATTFAPGFLSAHRPDLIPTPLPPAPGQAVHWRAMSDSSESLVRRSGSPGGGGGGGYGGVRRRDSDSGYEERKKWFEEALLSWNAQDEQEAHSGSSLYGPSYSRRREDNALAKQGPQWYQSAWSAWQGPIIKH